MDWDVIVIGAGPAGCFTAKSIALSGFKVLILEEDQEIGFPVQCAGLISPRVIELAGVDNNTVLNKLKGISVYSPQGAQFNVVGSKDLALAIDRAKFDQELATKAENGGAVLMKGVKVVGATRIEGGFRLTVAEGSKTISTKLLIGADGAKSSVSKWLGLSRDNLKAVMHAVDVQLKCADTSSISIFMGQKLAPGWFGWMIPLDEKTCRVGTGYALVKPAYSPRRYFQDLVDQFPQIFKDMKVIGHTGGIVPLGKISRIYAANAMLVGDAACQTKPISGGGIYMGLIGAILCSRTAVEALREDNLTEAKLSSYQKYWEKEMEKERVSAMKLRKSYLSFSDEDIDLVIRFLNKPKYQKLILKYGDLDYPSYLGNKLLNLVLRKESLIKATIRIF
ncbi:MAG: NAD(P)/FAD-dependent oxidoreductase [Anaerolineaceae bacterium]|nr:MAG: NAD(P)/FAD-dependent oxidoreductase [Anaerolineaceae bacterium]